MRKENEARRKLESQMHADMLRFAEFDADGNQELDFEEFYAMMPRRLQDTCSTHEIRTWFNAIDIDGKHPT